MRSRSRFNPRHQIVFCVLVATAVAARQAAPPAESVIADFDRAEGRYTQVGSVQLNTVDSVDKGDKHLRITPSDGGALSGRVLFMLPDERAAGRAGGVAARIRVVGEGGRATLRWLGVDAQNRIIFQRKLELEPSDEMRDVSLPWTHWRWGDSFGGSPSDIRRLGFRIDESPVTEIQVDNLRLTGPPGQGGAETPKDWLLRVAFGGRDVRVAEADGVLVATDAPDQLNDADLARILSRLRAIRAALRPLFGDAVQPVEGLAPPSLLIFRGQGAFIRFFEVMGKEWNVRIVPLPLPGMTIQNIGAAVFDPKQGADRPVFLHESVHVVLANDVRLNCNTEHHSWLQEGMAGYLQLCAYPESVAPRRLAEAFSKPVDPDAPHFKPLEELLRRRVNPPEYAQLASLIAYLVTEKPQWLPTIAVELTDGRTAEQAFRKCGTTLPQLEEAWMKWGKAHFAKPPADDGTVLPAPEGIRALRSK